MIARPRFHILTGCFGGGKSTLLAALAKAGHSTIPEPGRRIIDAGGPDPMDDPAAFARAALDLSLSDYAQAFALPEPVFFDRGLIDAAVHMAHLTHKPIDASLLAAHPFARTAFLAPPWPEIYVTDQARRHDLSDGIAEHDRLAAAYPQIGHDLLTLPKAPVQDRVTFVLDHAP